MPCAPVRFGGRGDKQPLSPLRVQLPLHRGAKRNGGAYASLAQGSQRDGVGTPPLCKGRCHSEAVTEGFPPLQNNTPSGETTPFAPKRPFGTFRCFAWLIRIKEHTVLFYSKRSCFRFAALTLRVSSRRNAPSGRSGVTVGLFPQRVHSTLCSKTLDLQVRFANPTGNFAPKRPFGTFRCCTWLIKIREHTVLSYLKRSCFRFASRRVQGSRKRVIPPDGSSC